MAFHLLTLKLQKDIPAFAGDYNKACEVAEAWWHNYAKSYDAASAADSFYANKHPKGSEAAELMAQAIISGKMRFALAPSGSVTVQEVEGVPTP
jgi:hypothetical protein